MDGLFHGMVASHAHTPSGNTIRCQWCRYLWKLRFPDLVLADKMVRKFSNKQSCQYYSDPSTWLTRVDKAFQKPGGQELWDEVVEARRLFTLMHKDSCTKYPMYPMVPAKVQCTKCVVNLCIGCWNHFHEWNYEHTI